MEKDNMLNIGLLEHMPSGIHLYTQGIDEAESFAMVLTPAITGPVV